MHITAALLGKRAGRFLPGQPRGVSNLTHHGLFTTT